LNSSSAGLPKKERPFAPIAIGMDNHIHLIRQMIAGIKPDVVGRDFMKFTA